MPERKRRKISSTVVAKVADVAVPRGLRVQLEAPRPIGPPKSYRLLGERRGDWILPCANGVDHLVMGDSQLKKSTDIEF